MVVGENELLHVCKMCGFSGSDVRLVCSNTSCADGAENSVTLHARCVPLSLLIQSTSESESNVGLLSVKAVEANSVKNPFNLESNISSIEIFALSSDLLDKAVEIRRKAASAQSENAPTTPSSTGGESVNFQGKRKRVASFSSTMAEASYLLLSSTYSPLEDLSSGGNNLFTDGDFQRIGRWTQPELEFVDFLLDAFDNGLLPIPHGMRLNDFLCQILLCKASRLTKKMKNARLSSRSYELKPPQPEGTPRKELDYKLLSTLQENFLQSLGSEASQLELRFNLSKTWRMQFLNLCVQVSLSFVNSDVWLSSVEQMERRATEAEETIRNSRRKRMGLALKNDAVLSHEGIFFGGMPFQNNSHEQKRQSLRNDSFKERKSNHHNSSQDLSIGTDESSEPDALINSMLDMVPMTQLQRVKRSNSFDNLSGFLDELADNASCSKYSSRISYSSTCGSFLERFVEFLEVNNYPFQHVDVFVPSLPTSDKNESIRLCHAGHATRSDLDPTLLCQLYEFGEYSTKFSFLPGIGLPGRVFMYAKPQWERMLDEADQKVFKRAGGAKIYGVKTALGIPMKSQTTGCMVVVLYSVFDMHEDVDLVNKLSKEVLRLSPEPKWKLVVDVSSDQQNEVKSRNPVCTGVDHFKHQPFCTSNETLTTPKVSTPSYNSDIQRQRAQELHIAKLLGDYMPLPHNSKNLTQISPFLSDANSNQILESFVSLRLLLLRQPQSRSSAEKEVVGIITSSYQGYAAGNKWSETDLAALVVKDWLYLRESTILQSTSSSTTGLINSKSMSAMEHYQHPPPPPLFSQQMQHVASSVDLHQSHVFNFPNGIRTHSFNGAPVRMPFELGNGTNSTTDRTRGGQNAQLNVVSYQPDILTSNNDFQLHSSDEDKVDNFLHQFHLISDGL